MADHLLPEDTNVRLPASVSGPPQRPPPPTKPPIKRTSRSPRPPSPSHRPEPVPADAAARAGRADAAARAGAATLAPRRPRRCRSRQLGGAFLRHGGALPAIAGVHGRHAGAVVRTGRRACPHPADATRASAATATGPADPAHTAAHGPRRPDVWPELIDVVKRAAREAVSPDIQNIQQQNQRFSQQVTRQNTQSLYGALDAQVPDWRAVNTNPRFKLWCRSPDIYSGELRGKLLNTAFQAADAPRVVAFFKGFLHEEVATGNAPGPQSEPQPAPRQAAVNLETLAAPGRAKPATGDTPASSADKPVFTRAQISHFYSSKAVGPMRAETPTEARRGRDLRGAKRRTCPLTRGRPPRKAKPPHQERLRCLFRVPVFPAQPPARPPPSTRLVARATASKRLGLSRKFGVVSSWRSSTRAPSLPQSRTPTTRARSRTRAIASKSAPSPPSRSTTMTLTGSWASIVRRVGPWSCTSGTASTSR